MKYNKNYDEYLFDLLFENESSLPSVKELPFVLSNRLKQILGNMFTKYDNKIAYELLIINKNRKKKKVTLIDIDEEDYNKFTFINSNKYFEYRYKNNKFDEFDVNDYLSNMDTTNNKYINDFSINRSSIKIGKFIIKIFGKDKFDNKDIEIFVNNIKSERKLKEESFDKIKIVNGQDIVDYYNEEMYDDDAFGGSSLGGSCMKYNSCSEYINFYAKNKGVKLVVLMNDDDNKIIARALLWDIEKIDGRSVDRKFMDRIYYVYQSDVNLLHEYAVKKNWLYKVNQNMDNYARIFDPEMGKSEYFMLETTRTFSKNNTYPYMDTMKYFLPDEGFLTNNNNIKDYYNDTDIYYLESTGGGWDDVGGIYVEYYDRTFSEDELVWCELGNEWRLEDDAYFINDVGEYATDEYVEDNMYYYDYYGEYEFKSDATYSDYKDEYIPDEFALKVYRTSDYDTIDELIEDDNTIILDSNVDDGYFPYESKEHGMLFFDSIYCIDDFDLVNVSDEPTSENSIYLHKKWDENEYFKWKGKYYINKLKDKLTGQKRLWENKNRF